MRNILFSAFLIPVLAFSQAPVNYYNGTSGLTGYSLKSKLHDIISAKTVSWHYSDLQNYYNQTDIDKYYDYDATNTTYLLDIYSNNPTGTTGYHYTSAQMIGSANAEGLGWNREHMLPQSSFNSNYPMYSDLFFVIPTDARINQLRSNYPYGIGGTTNYHSFTNGSKINNCAIPGATYTGRVYEPVNEFKGDIARSLLYFAVRYEGKLGSFNYNTSTNPASDQNPFNGTEEKAFENWYIAMLLQWHNQDPVSQREIDRNNAVYNLQKNRNPFVDHPEWVNMIWSQTPDSVAPQSPTNLSLQRNSAYFVTLSWNPSSDSDVIGYKIYMNGEYAGYTKDTSINIDHLSPSTAYNFTVRAYDTGYLESPDSNSFSVTTLDSDVYAKDLMITKYLEGTSNNKAIEITNKTGHAVNLNKYKIGIQFNSGSNYYFPAPMELEGIVENNETFVILNPRADFSCITNDQAKFVSAAPQMTFDGSNYVELRYVSTTVDAVGTSGINNFSVLGNVSIYRLPSATQPTNIFSDAEWQRHPNNYCEGLGILAASEVNIISENDFMIYPNPVVGNTLYIKGKKLEQTENASVYDFSGKLIQQENLPFKNKNTINIHQLNPGVYILKLDKKSLRFIKK